MSFQKYNTLQDLFFSIIIPIYNRPDEIEELLNSLVSQDFKGNFEVVVVEDGSTIKAETVANKFKKQLALKYYFKENSGPGLSRNYGMQKASGNYFIILDSDVILPKQYLSVVNDALQKNFTDAYGGADAAHQSFSTIQKAINYSMTSLLTTGGLRGHKKNTNFQPRSFNMGLSKIAFEKIGGFNSQRIGEDIDLTFRLWQNGFKTQFIEKAFVYHKRRSDFEQFFNQTFSFGSARPILNRQHQKTAKLTYWFPSFFVLGVVLSFFSATLTMLFGIYILMILLDASYKNKSIRVGFLSIIAVYIQMFGYGLGFLKSQFYLNLMQKTPSQTFPKMFS